jgi:hypothetical protein
VIVELTDEGYVRRPVGAIASSIGSHVRHCLDHVQAVLDAVMSGTVNFDHRQRGADVERSRTAALRVIERHETELTRLATRREWPPVRIVTEATGLTSSLNLPSCLARELVFVLSHTVHHCALIRVAVETLGRTVPDYFGYAPSTIAYLERQRCAR